MKRLYILIVFLLCACIKQNMVPLNNEFDFLQKELPSWSQKEVWKHSSDKTSSIDFQIDDTGLSISYSFNSGTWLQVEHEKMYDMSQWTGVQFTFQGTGANNKIQFKVEDIDGRIFGYDVEEKTKTVNWKRSVIEEKVVSITKTDLKYFWGGNDIDMNWKKIKKIYFSVAKDEGGEGSLIIKNFTYIQKQRIKKQFSEKKSSPSIRSGEAFIISKCDDNEEWKWGTAEKSILKLVSSSDKDNEEQKGVKVEFHMISTDTIHAWMYCNLILKENNNNFEGYDGIKFYLKGDGSTHSIYFHLKDSEGEHFLSQKNFLLKQNDDFIEYELPFTDFVLNSYQPEKDKVKNKGIIDFKSVIEIGIVVSELDKQSRKGYFYIDDISLY